MEESLQRVPKIPNSSEYSSDTIYISQRINNWNIIKRYLKHKRNSMNFIERFGFSNRVDEKLDNNQKTNLLIFKDNVASELINNPSNMINVI